MSKKLSVLHARGVTLAPLAALALGACLLAAMPQRAGAQASPDSEAAQDPLADLFREPAPDAADESAAPVEAADAPASGESSEPASVDELLPTIAVPQQAEAMPALKEPPTATQLEEIVVTATKRAANVREIPASISAIAGDELEQRGAQDTADIVKLVPGVNLTSTGDSPPRVTMRGISSDIGTGPTTGILFGNVSFTETYAPVVALDPNPFDMASVEALKGPQGTLYGASALNGAIRYVPVTPRFGEFEVKWFGQYTWLHEGDAAPTYGAAVNLPLGDSFALRVMGFDRTAPGFVDNTRIDAEDSNRTQQQGARALLGFRPDGDWDVLLTTAWQQTDYDDVSMADNDEGRLVTNDRPRRSPNHTEYSMADLTVSYSADWAEFVSDTSFIDKSGHNFFDATSRTLGNGAFPLVAQVYNGESTTIGQEFRLVSPDDPDSRWKWVAGLFAWQQNLENTLTVPAAIELTPLATILQALNLEALSSLFTSTGSPVVVQTAADVEVRELAAFGELTRRLGSDVELTLGGRLYRTSSGGENVQSGAVILAQQGSSPYVLAGDVSETGFNPKASVLWHINEDILTYGLVSKGFRVGGVQTGITTALSPEPAPDTFKSDTLWNYELGLRTQFFDNTLRMDLTGFLVDWKDPQSLQPDASGLAVYMDNVGGVESKGVDFQVQYLFPFGVMLSSAVSYAKTVTTEDFKTADGTVYPAGSNWPLAPQWQTSSNLSFMQMAGDWNLGGFITYSTIGKAVSTFGAHEVFGYRQLDLQFSASNQRLNWLPQIAVILNNVTDERGLTNAFTSGVPSAALAAEEYYYITPRSITVRLMGNFGG